MGNYKLVPKDPAGYIFIYCNLDLYAILLVPIALNGVNVIIVVKYHFLYQVTLLINLVKLILYNAKNGYT